MSFLINRKTAYFTAVVCTLLWGTAFPVIKYGYELMSIQQGDIPSKLVFAGARFFLGGLMVYIFGCASRRKPLKMQKPDIAPVLLLGLVQTALQYVFSYIGVGFTSASATSVITACMSFFVVILSPLFFKNDRLTAPKVIGCLAGFAGVALMSLLQGGAIGFSFMGEGMVLLSTLCAAGGNLLTKGFMNSRDAVTVTAFQLLLGGGVLLLSGFAFGGRINIFSTANSAVLLYLAFVSAAAFTLWTAVLKYHPVSRISVFNLLVPVFGTIISGILLLENVFTPVNIISLVLVCGGIFTVNAEFKGKENKTKYNEIKEIEQNKSKFRKRQ